MKASYNLYPVANDMAKENLVRTVDFTKSVGYWSAPAFGAGGGDKTAVGDQVWFYGGTREQLPTENCIQGIGNITEIIEPGTPLHAAMSNVWSGDWSDRRIVVFKLLSVLPKDKLTYDELCLLFSKGKRMKNGSYRVAI